MFNIEQNKSKKIVMSKIHILASTDRPNSKALKVARYTQSLLGKFSEVKTFSLQDFPLQDVAGGKYGEEIDSVKAFNEAFLDADGFLFVVPEYNGGFPGILKVFIDYLPFPKAIEKKPVSLIGEAAGSFGALRPVEHLQQILVYRKALIYPERMFISKVNDTFDEEGLKSERHQNLLEDQIQGFADFVEANTLVIS